MKCDHSFFRKENHKKSNVWCTKCDIELTKAQYDKYVYMSNVALKEILAENT